MALQPHIRSDGSAKVIPYNTPDILNNKGWKTAAILADIERGISREVLQRSAELKVKLKRVDPRHSMWTFHVTASPLVWKDKDPEYKVRVKAIRKGRIRDLEKADLKLACTCPFWKWQGPEHWAKVGDYLYGKPRGTASTPNVKDPRSENRLCKHAIAVVEHMRGKGMRVLDPPR